jgi:recombination DNA repair RAD52 pathway protein
MNREILEQPFGPDQIKQREGSFGKMLDYIEGHAVIQRLNDAFDGSWSFTINQHEILKETDEVIVIGELKAGNVVKTQFGSSRITRAKEGGEIISLADDLKAAATDALKKAATLLGVGLHLYRNDQPQMGNRPQGQQYNNSNRNNGSSGNRYNRTYQSDRNGTRGNGSRSNHGDGNGNGNGRLTSKQYKYMIQLSEGQGSSKVELDNQCLSMFGTASEYLSKRDASAVIDKLLAR